MFLDDCIFPRPTNGSEVVDRIWQKKQMNKTESSVAGFETNDVKTPTVDRIYFHAVIRNESNKRTAHHLRSVYCLVLKMDLENHKCYNLWKQNFQVLLRNPQISSI